MQPVDAVLAVTYRCNARCTMCGIWRSKPRKELAPITYRKLPPSLRDINLTGGEPFLRKDLPEIHEAARIAAPYAQTVVSTNGILTGQIVEAVARMAKSEPDIGVAVSIDGPADIHDRIRGVGGAYGKAIGTVKSLQDAGFTNLRLACTITKENVAVFRDVYALAEELGVQFTCAVEHTSEHYFQTGAIESHIPEDKLRQALAPVIRSELKSHHAKRWARAYFMQGLYDFAVKHERRMPCRAGSDFFFMDPVGDIFTCNAMPFRMGNLATQDFAALWDSPEAAEAREQVEGCQHGCWMICTSRTSIKRAWPRLLAWAMKYRFTELPIERSGP